VIRLKRLATCKGSLHLFFPPPSHRLERTPFFFESAAFSPPLSSTPRRCCAGLPPVSLIRPNRGPCQILAPPPAYLRIVRIYLGPERGLFGARGSWLSGSCLILPPPSEYAKARGVHEDILFFFTFLKWAICQLADRTISSSCFTLPSP